MADLRARMAAVAEAIEAELDRLLPRGARRRRRGCTRRCATPCSAAASGCGRSWSWPAPSCSRCRAARALRVGAAVELIHGYSLVHDDLPAMDDALTRRGRPSCHRQFDEATAILAGDALQSLAFEVLADPATHPDGGGALRPGREARRGGRRAAACAAAR